VTYHLFFGLIPINREYWMLDHTDEWFLMATPDLEMVNLYTRDPRPVPAVVERMTRQIREMGYAGELEFPAQAKP
jgi:lipocalin